MKIEKPAFLGALNIVCKNTNIDDKFKSFRVTVETLPIYIATITSERGTTITFICDTLDCPDNYVNIRADRCFVSNRYNEDLARQIMGIIKMLMNDSVYQIYKF